jgi:hypothetical protein
MLNAIKFCVILPSPTAALMAGEGELMLFIKIKFKVSIENVISEPKIDGAISSIITSYLSFSVDYNSVINNYY